MSDLTNQEKRKFERLFGMGSGYVFDFSNRTFEEFIIDVTGRSIYDNKYNYGSGSKANRLRAFWNEEPNHLTAKLLRALLDYGRELGAFKDHPPEVFEACINTVTRLAQGSAVADVDALVATSDGRDFDAVARAVRDAIDSNNLETGLDRLHTLTVKYVRTLCERRGITVSKEKPLHSIFGEYVRKVRESGHLESEMSARILKSSVSVLEAFNDVRNDKSLAHDNSLLNYDEALLIFNNVAASIRFLRSLERRLATSGGSQLHAAAEAASDDDVPF